jgi:hypothetical protein
MDMSIGVGGDKKRNEMYENMDSEFINIDMKVSRCAID